MSLATIRLSPNMSYDQLIQVVNENFALLENINVSQTFRDEQGTNRIILGRFPNGEYGLAISKPGEDVVALLSNT